MQCNCVCFGAMYGTTMIFIQGIACNMESPAFKYLHEATMEELGESKPFSMCGSLPLVGDMQEAGFDVQVRDLHIELAQVPLGLSPDSSACAKLSPYLVCLHQQ